MTPEYYMQQAIQKAWAYQLLTFPNPAVGCCVTDAKGAVLSIEAHQKAGGPHAEVLALKEAYIRLSSDKMIEPLKDSRAIHEYLTQHHQGMFESVTLYVTLEPCAHTGKTPPCALLIKTLGIKTVYIGSEDPTVEASGGKELLFQSGCHVQSGLCKYDADALLEPFIKWRQDRFVFFKWAQRLDGSVDGGTISCKQSRELVHGMRDRCDLLLIGGETVRRDRPTLDARLVDGRAPDLLIYSRKKAFDETIPLFRVANRTVTVSNSLDTLKKHKLVMVEGGPAFFEAFKEHADMFVCFVAPAFGGERRFEQSETFEILHQCRVGEDVLLWMRRRDG